MDGMLRDGSYYYGRKFNESINGLDDSIWKNKKFTDIIKRIRIGTSPFQFGNEANTNSISGVEELILVCKQNGDTVIFFFPPFAPLVSDLVKRSKYGYMNDASSKLSRLCRKYEIPFFDYSYFHSKDEQFVDGIHGGNELYYEILKSFHIGYNEISYINPFECRLDSILTKNRERFFAKPVPRALSVLRG